MGGEVMSEAKFTKGPWKISRRRHGPFVVESESTGFGVCATVLNEEIDEYNAHLITASPNTYHAAIEAMSLLERLGMESSDEYQALKSATTKARGEK